jgi:protease IV
MRLRTLGLLSLAAFAVVASCGIGIGIGAWSGTASTSSAPHLQVVRLEGMIVEPTKVVKKLIAARKDSAVKGVVLRIETPGGAVGASQEIFDAVIALAKVKPVVASIGNLGASGGYYAALGATRIMANPGSLTASIGVISQFTDAHELLEKVGVKMETVKSGEMKDAGSPFRAMAPKDRAYFQGVVNDVYAQFRAEVKRRRKVDSAALDTLADGRVLSGSQAKRAGLIDTLGGYEDAIGLVRSLAKLPESTPVTEDIPKTSFVRRLLDPEEEGLSRFLPLGDNSTPVQFKVP